MQHFAGVDFRKLNLNKLDFDTFHKIQASFIKFWIKEKLPIKYFKLLENTILHLDNYRRLCITPTLNADQTMALAIWNFPQRNFDPQDDIEWRLRKVSNIIAKYNYRSLSLAQILAMITKEKKALHCKNESWEYTATATAAAAMRCNLYNAWGSFFEIAYLFENLSAQERALLKPRYWRCLEVIYLVALLDHVAKEREFYENNSDFSGFYQRIYGHIGHSLRCIHADVTATDIYTQLKANASLLFSSCHDPLSAIKVVHFNPVRRSHSAHF